MNTPSCNIGLTAIMNRRKLLLTLGATAVTLTGLNPLRAAEHGTHSASLADPCARACADCLIECAKHVPHCTRHLAAVHGGSPSRDRCINRAGTLVADLQKRAGELWGAGGFVIARRRGDMPPPHQPVYPSRMAAEAGFGA